MRKMSNQKKRLVVLTVLLITLLVIAVLDQDISILEYICLFANAGVCLGLAFALQTQVDELWREVARRSVGMWRNLIKIGMGEHIKEIEALPKVPSATGQIYVDYEEVMRIIRGDELIER